MTPLFFGHFAFSKEEEELSPEHLVQIVFLKL